MEKIYMTYPISDTLNNKVDYQKLYLEFSASNTPVECAQGINGEIFLCVKAYPNSTDKLAMDAIVAAHDGEHSNAYEEAHIHERDLKVRELNQLAIFHPLLDNTILAEYLTSIDNWVNAYVRLGINTVLITKILADAQVGQPYYDFLNIIVNEAGNKTYEYFIGKVS